MKLKWLSLFALVLMVGFVGCGQSADDASGAPDAAAPADGDSAPAAVDEGSADAPAAMMDDAAHEGHEATENMPAEMDHEGSDHKADATATIDGLAGKAKETMASVASALTEQTVEAGCAKCEYKMAGVSACALAVKVGDTPHIISGEGIGKPSEVGLCQGTKQAKIAGNMLDDGTISVTQFDLNQ
jgi:Family of unknown function (DUF6370)